MPWTSPTHRAAGYVVLNDTDWNEMVMDNLDYLYGLLDHFQSIVCFEDTVVCHEDSVVYFVV